MSFDDVDFLVKLSRMYYDEERPQKEIADYFNISRSQVSKYLSKAKRLGIVETIIHDNTANRYVDLESEIQKLFGLDHVVLCSTVDAANQKNQLAQAARDYFLRILKPNSIIAVSAGTTVHLMASSYPYTSPMESLTFVPLSGGLGKTHQDIQANVVCELFSQHSGGHFLQLHAPIIVDSSFTKSILLKETFVDSIFSVCKKADICLLGIGNAPIYEEMRATYLANSEVTNVDREIVVGDVSYNFIDKNGEIVDCAWNNQVIALNLSDLKGIPIRLGIAGGPEKVSAIAAAIQGKIVNSLVTDVNTAQKLLKYKQLK
ncbi:transcriptional regulator [Enterococcus florum]|uniref:Transcriptional regulator n=1 Tax=Enterococcus florum TaxID=2480627 RepID=A0A4P5PFZ8_9ENTE|nr:sugar-binding domain-containing protein [Enterococcus florum]GCF95704.1 transcriptional regulator [Enterococcus florum]